MLKELSYVLAVAEKGKVSRAAEALFISQPSLSRYIKDLENRLGVQLFQRINNRFVLTYAGEKYVETAKKITDLYNTLEKDLSDIHEELYGRLKIGCAMLRMSYNMPTILKAFVNKYPNVELQLYENYTTKGLEDMLLRGELDLAIINPRNVPHLKYIPFFEEELLVAVPQSQSLTFKGIERPECKYPWIDIRQLHNQPYIALNGEQSIAIRTREIFEENHVVPATILRVKSVESVFRLAEVGLGCAVIPESVIKIPSVPQPPLFFSFGSPVVNWTLAIAYREDTVFSNTAVEFINLVSKTPGLQQNGAGQ